MATDVVKQIRKATRRKFTADEKIRVVLKGLREEITVSELCRKHGIQSAIYYKWSKAFLDAAKRMTGMCWITKKDFARISLLSIFGIDGFPENTACSTFALLISRLPDQSAYRRVDPSHLVG